MTKKTAARKTIKPRPAKESGPTTKSVVEVTRTAGPDKVADFNDASESSKKSEIRKRTRRPRLAGNGLRENGDARAHADQVKNNEIPLNPAATQKGVKGFRRGQSGNPNGRPKGSRNKATLLADSLLEGESEELKRALIEKAKAGDWPALKLAIELLCSKARPRLDSYELPAVETAEDIRKVTSQVIQAVSGGDLSPETAANVTRLLDLQIKTIANRDLIERLEKLIEARRVTGWT